MIRVSGLGWDGGGLRLVCLLMELILHYHGCVLKLGFEEPSSSGTGRLSRNMSGLHRARAF